MHYEVMVRYGRGLNTRLLGQIPANTTDDVLRNKRRVLEAEQYVPSSLLLRAFEVDPATGAAKGSGLNLTREVRNTVEDQSLDDYVVTGEAIERLKVLAINDSLSRADSSAKHRAGAPAAAWYWGDTCRRIHRRIH